MIFVDAAVPLSLQIDSIDTVTVSAAKDCGSLNYAEIGSSVSLKNLDAVLGSFELETSDPIASVVLETVTVRI